MNTFLIELFKGNCILLLLNINAIKFKPLDIEIEISVENITKERKE